MIASQKGGDMTQWQIMMIAAELSPVTMRCVARDLMGFSEEFIDAIQGDNKGYGEAFKREILQQWTNMQPENQVKVTTANMFI